MEAAGQRLRAEDLNFVVLRYLESQGANVAGLLGDVRLPASQGRRVGPWPRKGDQDMQEAGEGPGVEGLDGLQQEYEKLVEESQVDATYLSRLLTTLLNRAAEDGVALSHPVSVSESSVVDLVEGKQGEGAGDMSLGTALAVRGHVRSWGGRVPSSTMLLSLIEHGVPVPRAVRTLPFHFLRVEKMHTIEAHRAAAYCVLYDNSGRRIITGSDDASVKVWTSRGVLLYCLRGHSGFVTDMSINPKNTMVASGDSNHEIRIWSLGDAETSEEVGARAAGEHYKVPTVANVGENIVVMRQHREEVTVVTFSPNPNVPRLLTCDNKGEMYVWNTERWEIEKQFFSSCTVEAASWHMGGEVFAAAGGTSIRICSASTGGELACFDSSEGPLAAGAVDIRTLQWAPNGQHAVCVGGQASGCTVWRGDGSMKEWKRLKLLLPDGNDCSDSTILQFSGDGNYVAAAHTSTGILQIWDAYSGQHLHQIVLHTDNVYTMLAHPVCPRLMFSAGYDGLVLLFDTVTGKIYKAFRANIGLSDGAMSPGGSEICFTDLTGNLTIFSDREQPAAFRDVPNSQFFSSELNPLAWDDEGVAMDSVLQVMPHLVPRDICDKNGRPHLNLPQAHLGPVKPLASPGAIRADTEAEDDCLLEIPAVHEYRLVDDGTPGITGAQVPAPLEVAPVEPSVVYVSDNGELSDSSDEEDDDDDWQNWQISNRYSRNVGTMQTRRSQPNPEFVSLGSHEEPTSGPASSNAVVEKFSPYPAWVTTPEQITNCYIPQIRDEVVYMREGHIAYNRYYRDRIRCLPIEKPHIRCQIVDIGFELVPRAEFECSRRFRLTLRVDDEEGHDTVYEVLYHPLSCKPDFLVLKSKFDAATLAGVDDPVGKKFQMYFPMESKKYSGEVVGMREGKRFEDSYWEDLHIKWLNDTMGSDDYISRWEVTFEGQPGYEEEASPGDGSSQVSEAAGASTSTANGAASTSASGAEDEEMAEAGGSADGSAAASSSAGAVASGPADGLSQEVRETLMGVIDEVIAAGDEAMWFAAPVDVEQIPMYPEVVCYPCDLSLVKERLQCDYYRRHDAVLFDVLLIVRAAETFNVLDSDIVVAARYVCSRVIHQMRQATNETELPHHPELLQYCEEPRRSSRLSNPNGEASADGQRRKKALYDTSSSEEERRKERKRMRRKKRKRKERERPKRRRRRRIGSDEDEEDYLEYHEKPRDELSSESSEEDDDEDEVVYSEDDDEDEEVRTRPKRSKGKGPAREKKTPRVRITYSAYNEDEDGDVDILGDDDDSMPAAPAKPARPAFSAVAPMQPKNSWSRSFRDASRAAANEVGTGGQGSTERYPRRSNRGHHPRNEYSDTPQLTRQPRRRLSRSERYALRHGDLEGMRRPSISVADALANTEPSAFSARSRHRFVDPADAGPARGKSSRRAARAPVAQQVFESEPVTTPEPAERQQEAASLPRREASRRSRRASYADQAPSPSPSPSPSPAPARAPPPAIGGRPRRSSASRAVIALAAAEAALEAEEVADRADEEPRRSRRARKPAIDFEQYESPVKRRTIVDSEEEEEEWGGSRGASRAGSVLGKRRRSNRDASQRQRKIPKRYEYGSSDEDQ